ncbi:hypothetical protein [Mesorhizobium sp.]|uniref:hypothetical protein n=1 Tax=Mesorhizobium sp. TaxID=1871066 RepID=UPI000FE7EA91|nr:hypothetical protein [Mesorhizobium sp.]RWF71873.1 MAG: hypothetical protein EOQ34_13950 [Mesorhizobium sp.]TIN03873.1 MAG: hypothetical protein E5Y38_06335 [Mesorhizobium sp.]TIQ95494.1 MAG: hypothetical protein E5X36_21850 [Mesorhizobium sp.]
MTTHSPRSSRGARDINHIAPAAYDKLDVEAVKAVAGGNASAGQQKRALAWIVNHAARTYDEPFVPGAPDVCAHLTGRMNVGRQILKLVNTPIHLLTNGKE